MKMYFVMKFLVLLTVINSAYCLNLICNVDHTNFSIPGVQSCIVNKNFTIVNENEEAIIKNVSNKSTVQGFSADQIIMFFIPRGIGTYLTKLKNLLIKNSSLKEVTSENLKEFPNLIYLDLSFNHIKILDKDVFQHNQNLKFMYLNDNQIFAIDSGAFDMFKKDGGMLTSLNLYGNECKFLNATNRTYVLKLIGNIQEKCWNETSKTKFNYYKQLGRSFEIIEAKITNQYENIQQLTENDSSIKSQIESLQVDLNEMNITYFDNFKAINESIEGRIKRSADEIQGKIEENNAEIKNLILQVNSSQSAILIDILGEVRNISMINEKVDDLDRKLDSMKQDFTSNLQNHEQSIQSKIQETTEIINKHTDRLTSLAMNLNNLINKFNNLQTNSETTTIPICIKTNTSPTTSSIISEYLNTILLIIIIAFQSITFCCKNRPKSKKFQPKFFTAPPSLDPIYYTTATQLADNFDQRRKHYESLDDIQGYDFIASIEKPNNLNIVKAEVEHQGFSNDIYGTVKASNEDLYAEVISPKIIQSSQNVNSGADIYAEVNKKRNG